MEDMKGVMNVPTSKAGPTRKQIDKNRPLKIRSPEVRIIAVSSIERYRQLARELPTCHDSVLEIGCSTGMATRLLAKSGAHVIAVDVAGGLVEKLLSELADLENVTVAQVDGRDTPQLLTLAPKPDLVFIDIGGDAHLDNVALQLRQCLRAFAPRLIVVRSRELALFSSLIADIELSETSELLSTNSQDGIDHTLANLLDLSQSSNTNCRIFAARRLRTLTLPIAQERLKEMANDPHPKVRRTAQLGHKVRETIESHEDP